MNLLPTKTVLGTIPAQSPQEEDRAAMSKRAEGYHDLFVRIPEIVWERLNLEADATGDSVTRIVQRLLQRRYRLTMEELPKRRKPGRPVGAAKKGRKP